VAVAQAPSISEDSVQFEKLRGQYRIAIAQKELAAVKAKAEVYSEEIEGYRQAAKDARQSAQEAKETSQSIVLLVPLVAALAIVVVVIRSTRENRRRLEADIQRTVLATVEGRIDHLLSKTPAPASASPSADYRGDRLALLEGLRVLYYREAAEARGRDEWGSAVLFTVQALVAEFEAAETADDAARRNYARAALDAHGGLIRDHVDDFQREAERAAWDTRDLDQVRKLKAFAPDGMKPILDRLELATLESIDRSKE
jgi:hypothetical protein